MILDVARYCLFVLSFFPQDVLDEIFNLIESVSEALSFLLLLCRKNYLHSEYTTFRKSFVVRGSKQGVTDVVSFCKIDGKHGGMLMHSICPVFKKT